MAVIAPALARLRAEINKRWPSRDKRTDGWIGDTSHQSSGRPENGGSDHNVNKRGIVDAYDIDVDGIDCPTVVAAATRHTSTNYVIWSRKIWSRSRGFKVAAYTGSNPHTDHIHLSLLQTSAAENNTAAWGLADGVSTLPAVAPAGAWPATLAATMPVVEQGPLERGSVRKLQALLSAVGGRLDTDGVFGPATATAVRAFQQANGLTVDAVVGPKTWTALFGPLPTVAVGASGGTVRKLQELLNVAGAALDPDSQFGSGTATAVREFQARFALTVDAIVGPDTWTALATR